MRTFFVLSLSAGLCLLAACASDPMKPDRPNGKRVPINLTPPPVEQPMTPPASPAGKEPKQGVDRNG
ncbi:hypothetical protein ACE15N_22765 (plasmid) [Xanthomonas campestris pv. passiflorae]|uniref:hypothetical protein n=1 Tax=Xanthomonas TaxID=338 RepID=UPI0012673F0B|nr:MULTISPECIES: hypothetical protein [Xanthomonas]MBV6816224.1 hypothetical protein [Xanthomonas campestris pv. passiflorae]MDN0293101.1 hypothetical protein [Xanthomonas arboricola pv. pruni]